MKRAVVEGKIAEAMALLDILNTQIEELDRAMEAKCDEADRIEERIAVYEGLISLMDEDPTSLEGPGTGDTTEYGE